MRTYQNLKFQTENLIFCQNYYPNFNNLMKIFVKSFDFFDKLDENKNFPL